MNPPGQPFPSQFNGAPPPSGSGGGGGAREALNVPGILFLVFGSLTVLFGLFGLVSGGGDTAQLDKMLGDPNFPAALKGGIRFMAGPGSKLINLLGMAIGGVIAFGGLQMRQLKNYSVVMAASVLACLPCGSCCCVTMPIGIWALTLIFKPEIKSSFS